MNQLIHGCCSKPPTGRVIERTVSSAVRLAECHFDRSTLLAAGLLPGGIQTAYKSELFTVVRALAISSYAELYTDCPGVGVGTSFMGTAESMLICGD